MASEQIWMPVFSALTGAVIAAGVSWVSNHRTDLRDARKLQFDAEQKELDRKLSLKKDIYLAVASDFARFQVSLSTLGDTPIADLKTLLPFGDFAAAFARLEIVAPLPLYQAAHEAGKFIRTTFGPLVVERIRLQCALDDLAETVRDSDEPSDLQQIEHLSKEALKVRRQSLEWEHNAFRLRCTKHSLELKRRLIPFVRELRREFDTAIDMKQFDAIQSDSLKDAEMCVEDNLRSLNEHFGTKLSETP